MSTCTSLIVITKNEAATLPVCLDSVQGLVDEIIVVDTGSTDATRQVALRHGARVFDFAWRDDFAAARNECLRHATADWLLWLDADEHFDDANRHKLRALIAQLPDHPAAFVMKQRSPAAGGAATAVDQVRLFKNHPAVRWDYRVHEQLLPSLRQAGHELRWTDIAVTHTGYADPALRAAKLQRNLRLLLLEQAERPDDPFTLFNLGWAYAELGRLADAIPLLERSLARSQKGDSIVRKLYALLSQCHDRLGRPREALAACRAGRVWCPDDAELLFAEGGLLRRLGDAAGAEAAFRQLLPADGDPPSAGSFASVDEGLRGHLAWNQLALLSRQQGRHAEAEGHWRAALAQAPAFLPALLGLAETALHAGRWDELERLTAEVEPQSPVDAAVLRARGLLARKDFAAARRLLGETIAQHPQALAPRILLTHALLQEGTDAAAAEAALRDVLERDPGQAESWRNLAVLLRNQGRLADAAAVCQSARRYRPDDPDLLLMHGMLLAEVGDPAQAEACLVRLLEIDSSKGAACGHRRTARHNLALLWRGQGRLAEASAQWRALLAEEPGLAAARLALAEVCLALGQLGEAEQHLARLEADAPDARETLLVRGRLHLARRDFAAARRAFVEAGERQPRALAPRVLLSYVLLQEGTDAAAAEQALGAVLALDPGNTEARHNLALLRRQREGALASGSGE
jgi:tetratricopeptide (TPR) repeat protein